jgi:hypothetical protein
VNNDSLEGMQEPYGPQRLFQTIDEEDEIELYHIIFRWCEHYTTTSDIFSKIDKRTSLTRRSRSSKTGHL